MGAKRFNCLHNSWSSVLKGKGPRAVTLVHDKFSWIHEPFRVPSCSKDWLAVSEGCSGTYNLSGQRQVNSDSIGHNFPNRQSVNTKGLWEQATVAGEIFHWTGGNLEQDQVNLVEPPAGGQFRDKLFELTHWSYCELLFHKYHINSVIFPPPTFPSHSVPSPQVLLRTQGSNPQLQATNWLFLSAAFCFLFPVNFQNTVSLPTV